MSITEKVTMGDSVSLETVRQRKDGTLIDVSVLASPIFVDETLVGVYGIYRNITDRKKAEEKLKASLKEKEVLLREIHHRVKNNLQVISSLLTLQSNQIKGKKNMEFFKDSQNRVKSMALIHEKLYQSHNLARINFKEYLSTLVNGLFRSYHTRSSNITLKLDVEDVSLEVDSAIPCGLIVNELVSNSLKYAFPDERKGEIRVALRSLNKKNIELVVSDNGIGIPDDFDVRKAESLGLHLVTILAEDQLDGEIKLSRDHGTEFRIILGVLK
jgi:two-component sensor histidine kinase